MKKKELVNGAAVRRLGDNRQNFEQVPAMTRPIPPPQQQAELQPHQEEIADTSQEPRK